MMTGAIDPELLDLLEVLPTQPLNHENLGTWRSMVIATPAPVASDDLNATPVKVSTRYAAAKPGDREIPLRLYEPIDPRGLRGCIFHIHGGGFVMGDCYESEIFHRFLARRLNTVLVSVGYRLAPETRFPGNIEDCYMGLAWVFEHARELGIDPSRVGVMGESAGGGLAAALALMVRDKAEYCLAFQHLVYPMLDDRTCVSNDPHPLGGQWVWTREHNAFGWTSMLGHEPGRSGVSPYAAPARASCLEGLPPAFIATAALDLFLEEDVEYARRLSRASVPLELHVYPRAFHGFDLHPTAEIAQLAKDHRVSALSRALRVQIPEGPRAV
jgi:acetyl esterase/lipase